MLYGDVQVDGHDIPGHTDEQGVQASLWMVVIACCTSVEVVVVMAVASELTEPLMLVFMADTRSILEPVTGHGQELPSES